MRRMQRIVLLATFVAVVPVLAGCANFDPDSLDIFGLSDKKKLPGDRRPVFPEGVPGVTQGVPPQYIKGNQPTPDVAATAPVGEGVQPQAAAPAAPVTEAPAEPAPKPKRKVAARPKPATAAPVQPVSQQPQQQQAQPQPAWPAPAPAPAASSGTTAWPAPPPTGTFSR